MKFAYLEGFHKNRKDILVIGKTIEHDNRKYHMIGMTLADEAKLYIIEPYSEPENISHRTKGVHTHRQLQKEHRRNKTYEITYLHCSDFYLGE